jgi:hypothetical protein
MVLFVLPRRLKAVKQDGNSIHTLVFRQGPELGQLGGVCLISCIKSWAVHHASWLNRSGGCGMPKNEDIMSRRPRVSATENNE